MKRTDADIQRAVLRELERDTRVTATEIGVVVSAGVVTLTGVVSSLAERLAAQDAAHRVAEVLDVANDIEVRALGEGKRSDAEIARAVRHALEWDAFVPETRIRSTVSEGWVTLEGDVDHFQQRADAERAVVHLTGVRGITNAIEIDATLPVLPYRLETAIETALERHAKREARRITLEIEDGRVTVFGDVGSWSEKQAVLGAVKGTPGVHVVDDRLQVERM